MCCYRWTAASALTMRRAAYVLSWIMFALTTVVGVVSYLVAVSPLSGLWAVPAAVFVVTLVAFHFPRRRCIGAVALVLNAVLVLAGCALIGLGIDFSAGTAALMVAMGLGVLSCLPSVFNVVALFSYVRRVSVVPAT